MGRHKPAATGCGPDGYAIDIRDERLLDHAAVPWPFAKEATFLLEVDVGQVLSTVVINTVHGIAVYCPWERGHCQTIFGALSSRYEDDDE